jgi:hypothetical protein
MGKGNILIKGYKVKDRIAVFLLLSNHKYFSNKTRIADNEKDSKEENS